MKTLKVILTSGLLVLGLIVSPGASTAAESDVQGLRTIRTLAAATSATVFAETSYGSYGGFNLENGSYWYRDGYPYPGEQGYNQGGWGFSESENFGSYHPNNCHSNIDPNGLCFETGDANGYHDYVNEIQACPWGTNYSWCRNYGYYNYGYFNGTYTYYRYYSYDNGWVNGSRGHMKSGGSLGSTENPDAYRAFFNSDDPSYYPSGIQHDVPLLDIYDSGWTLCWSGSYNSQSAVEEIKSACNGTYTIMAGSYENPEIQSPTVSNPAMTSSNGVVAASWTVTNRDQVEMSNGIGRITDLESGKQFTCNIEMVNDPSKTEDTVGCSFADSMLQHRYSLSMSVDAENFDRITGGEIEDKLVITDEFQVVPTRLIGKASQDAEVCVHHAVPDKIVSVRVGPQNRNIRTDSNGHACATYLLPAKASKQTATAFYGKVKSISSLIYMPVHSFTFKGGKTPKLTLNVRGLPKFASVEMRQVSRSSGAHAQLLGETPVSLNLASFIMNVPLQPDTYDIHVFFNKNQHSGTALEVVSKQAGGGFRN